MATSGVNNTMKWELDDGVLTLSPVDGEATGVAKKGDTDPYLLEFFEDPEELTAKTTSIIVEKSVSFESEDGTKVFPGLNRFTRVTFADFRKWDTAGLDVSKCDPFALRASASGVMILPSSYSVYKLNPYGAYETSLVAKRDTSDQSKAHITFEWSMTEGVWVDGLKCDILATYEEASKTISGVTPSYSGTLKWDIDNVPTGSTYVTLVFQLDGESLIAPVGSTIIPEAFYLLDFDKGGRSIGIGTEAAEYDTLTDAQKETGLLDVGMQTRFTSTVSADSLTATTATATDTTTGKLTATTSASLTGDTTVTNGDECAKVVADTGAAPSGAAYTSGTYVQSNDFCVQVHESDGTVSEGIRLYQNGSGTSTASFGYGVDDVAYYKLANSFAITTVTLFSSKSFTSKAYADGSVTLAKADWYPLGIIGENVNTRYVTINRKYLESRKVGGATLKWMAENWDTSTHSATANVNVLWARG